MHPGYNNTGTFLLNDFCLIYLDACVHLPGVAPLRVPTPQGERVCVRDVVGQVTSCRQQTGIWSLTVPAQNFYLS